MIHARNPIAILWAALALLSLPLHAAELPAFGTLLFEDDFRSGLQQWHIEQERPGHIRASDGVLDVDVPAGATLWFKRELEGPIAIVYDATAIEAGGANDRVSDINCFWMARNRDDTGVVYEKTRSGGFADYNSLLTYYVGLGGNGNTTTRFRRYIGDPIVRPLLPEHDLAASEMLLAPNRKQRITLIANGNDIEFWRDGERLLRFHDPEPYVRGWFALRTTQSHVRFERLRIYSLRR